MQRFQSSSRPIPVEVDFPFKMYRLGIPVNRRCCRVNILCRSFKQPIRFQSKPSDDDRDQKLKDIIESSNLGSSFNAEKHGDIPKPPKSEPIQGSTVSKNADPVVVNDGIIKDIKSKTKDLPSHKEQVRANVTKMIGEYMEKIQASIFKATTTLNDVTGYSSIEKLKESINTLEEQLSRAKDEVKQAKDNYSQAIQQRSALQKEVNELLTRKNNWNPDDLERFTQLYRNDHANEQLELSTQQAVTKAEQEVDSIQLTLTQMILTRYHEEQIWSDKIRRASTWGTWLLMGFNILLFFIATFIVEPWKRKRMVGSFEDRVKLAIMEMSQEQSGKFDKLLTNQSTLSSESANVNNNVYWFRVPLYHTWNDIKQIITSNYKAVFDSTITGFQITKSDLVFLLSFVSLISCTVSSMLLIFIR